MGQSVRRIDPLGGGVGLGAEGPPIDRGFVHSGHFNEFTILDKSINAASPTRTSRPAHATDCWDHLLTIFLCNFLGFLIVHQHLVDRIFSNT